MTRDEAATLLGVAEDAAPAIVRQRFEALHNDYHMRLTNAPTPALKKAYQRNLQELQDACRTLAPGFEIATTQDLPAPEPIHGVEVRESPRRAAATPGPTVPPSPRDDGSISRAARWAIVAAAVCAAAATLFALLWQRDAAAGKKLGEELAASKLKLSQVAAVNDQLQAVLKPAPLKVCNESSRQVRITSAVAVYPTGDGSIRSVFSGSYNYPTWEIRPGARLTLSISRGNADDWDGTAALYSLLVEYPGMEPYLVSGLMSNHKTGCVNLTFD